MIIIIYIYILYSTVHPDNLCKTRRRFLGARPWMWGDCCGSSTESAPWREICWKMAPWGRADSSHGWRWMIYIYINNYIYIYTYIYIYVHNIGVDMFMVNVFYILRQGFDGHGVGDELWHLVNSMMSKPYVMWIRKARVPVWDHRDVIVMSCLRSFWLFLTGPPFRRVVSLIGSHLAMLSETDPVALLTLDGPSQHVMLELHVWHHPAPVYAPLVTTWPLIQTLIPTCRRKRKQHATWWQIIARHGTQSWPLDVHPSWYVLTMIRRYDQS